MLTITNNQTQANQIVVTRERLVCQNGLIVKPMPVTAVRFALKHKLGLGQDVKTGLFFIRRPGRVGSDWSGFGADVDMVSLYPTARSAINMMKRYLRENKRGS